MSDKKINNKQQEEYLNKFLPKSDDISSELNQLSSQLKQKDPNTLEYLSVDLSVLPLGIFYPDGLRIKIRAAKVFEVQAYSVVDDSNFLDVTEKMNQLLSSCVKVTLPNGNNGSYKDIKDGDRLYIIFMIRELTFQKGNSLAKEITCNHCSHEFSIPFRATSNMEYPKTFKNHEMSESLERFFNSELKCFEFNIDNAIYRLAPPTIGIQEIFYGDIKDKVQNKKNPNVSFLKIIPFMLYDRTTITNDGIKAKEDEFKKLDMYTFQVLNQAVDKMVFGLKGLEMECPECGMEVHTDMTFPNGASSLFVIPDWFDNFIKK
jgi:hypothetical protein